MTKLLAVDLDGTLVHDRKISPEDRAALARWRHEGNILAIATGRSFRLASASLSAYDVEFDYAVCHSGTVVTDGQGIELCAAPLPSHDVRAVIAPLLERDDCSIFASAAEGDYVIHDPLIFISDQRALVDDHFTPASLDDLAARTVTAIPIYVPDIETCDTLAAEITEYTYGSVDCLRSTGFIDVVTTGHDKGTGLRFLLARLGAEGHVIETFAAVGDSWNDIPMFDMADVPAAINGAPQVVQDAAGGKTIPNVAAFISELLA